MECIEIDANGEREEGEIFDDDLETISDDSIAPSPQTGKLNATEESLRALSLSSVSDLEVLECSSSSSNHKHRRWRHVKKRRKLHKRYKRSSSESSSENEETRITKKLLKEAIRRDTEEIHNKSLRTRLKNMVQKSALTEDTEIDFLNDCHHLPDDISFCGPISNTNEIEDEEMNKSPIQETLSFDGDEELTQLRLEALKTAVINKFQRKKRKIKVDQQEESKSLETNKENSSDNVNTQICNSEDRNPEEEISERSQVVGNLCSPNSAINSEEDVDEDILRAVLLASMAKKMTNKVPTPKKKNSTINSFELIKKQVKQEVIKPNINPPKIKPFIISINNPDSDSNDDDFNDADEIKNNKVIDNVQLELKIDNFLKQQRAEVEAKTNLTHVFTKTNLSKNLQTKQNVEINSLYKLLPKNKQLEYEKLIQKLKSAEKKTRVKRISGRISDHKIQRNKALSRTSGTSMSIAGSFQHQLRQVQQQVSGRLQKEKYQELSSLMTKLNEANEEQKKHEVRIKHLLKQLEHAREQSAKSQQVFSTLMKEFLKKKEEIDSNSKRVPVPQPRSEAPRKLPPSKTNSETNPQNLTEPTCPIEKLSDIRNDSVHCKIVLEKCPVNLEDPNDIEFKTLPKVENSAVPKYSSPLDYMGSKNNKIHNPMEILCPFEMDGLCRDKDCIYNHCNQE